MLLNYAGKQKICLYLAFFLLKHAKVSINTEWIQM